MKQLTTILSFIFIAQASAQYQLHWSDEFDSTALNSKYWTPENGGSSNWNNTAINDPSVIEVSNGTLKLRGIKNPNSTVNLSTVQNIDRNTVWTGAVHTQNKVDFKYGKLDVRARIESAARAWPAIWLMPTHSIYGGNPYSGEIDMVEHLNFDSFFYSTVHTEYHLDYRNDPERYGTGLFTNNDNEWVVYTIEWDEYRIDFLRNGIKYHTVNKGNSSYVNGKLRWPFDEEFYIILSQQIGGGWVDGEAKSKGLVLKDSDLPLTMEIDYVRLYKPISVGTEKRKQEQFKAYRKSNGTVQLSLKTSWSIFDISGKLLLQGKGNQIPMQSYSSGVYLVRTKYGTQKIAF